MTTWIKRYAVVFGIGLLCFPLRFTGQQAGAQIDRIVRAKVLAEQLRWRTESGREKYEAKKSELTDDLLAEINNYVTATFAPGSATAEQVQSGLNDLLGYKKGLGIQNVAFLTNLPKGDFLIVGIEIQRGGSAINEDYICFRAYSSSGEKYVHVASTGNLNDSYLVGLNARALEPLQTGGEFWFIAWAVIPPQSPYTIVIRLYAFDGRRFQTVWVPQNIVAASIDNAVQVGPTSVFTLSIVRLEEFGHCP